MKLIKENRQSAVGNLYWKIFAERAQLILFQPSKALFSVLYIDNSGQKGSKSILLLYSTRIHEKQTILWCIEKNEWSILSSLEEIRALLSTFLWAKFYSRIIVQFHAQPKYGYSKETIKFSYSQITTTI